MWRRVYLGLLAVRLYFALQPSYIHPDEHFQGPEVIAGQSDSIAVWIPYTDFFAGEVFGWPYHKTWEFTSANPIRSIFPLSLVYGFPLTILKWIWEGHGYGAVPPLLAFYILRVLMFVLSFVLEDWAIHELLPLPRERHVAITLIASSYVTWTFQTHTFSNSIETLLVLWCIVLIQRIRTNTESTMARSCAALAFLGVLGTFNRITFPAFLVIPAVQLVPHLFVRTLRIPILVFAVMFTVAIGITMDTEFYTGIRPGLLDLYNAPVFTPWNNLMYNMDSTNLAKHGLHPFWQHFAANLPQLMGPTIPLVLLSSRRDALFWSGISGIALLSCFKHQEARFLLPAIPLLLACVKVPRRLARTWTGTWILFNVLAGIVFGIYHQGGVVPAQTWISQQSNIGHVFWWKTYSPPHWLLDGSNSWVTTHDFMGMPWDEMVVNLRRRTNFDPDTNRTLLVAPLLSHNLDASVRYHDDMIGLSFHKLWSHRQHVGLDDLDFGDDGVWPTLERVVGKRGLGVWEVLEQ